MSLLWRLLVNAVAIWVAVRVVDGLEFTGTWMQMGVVAGVLALVNALVRPVLTMLTCPLVLLTRTLSPPFEQSRPPRPVGPVFVLS